MFEDNGYSKKEITDAMKERTTSREDPETHDLQTRGIVVMPNVPNFTSDFNKIARKHGFRVANNTENRVRDLTSSAKTPLGEKNTNVVYNVSCKCGKYSYTGETDRKWSTRKKEHQDKVRLTKQDLERGNTETASKRMNEGDGGLAKHATICAEEIDWEGSKIVGKETRWTQRKFLEGVETLREKNSGIVPLNSYNKLEQWQSILFSLFKE